MKDNYTGIQCPHCGGTKWTYKLRHPADPAKDEFKCDTCKGVWNRYDNVDPKEQSNDNE